MKTITEYIDGDPVRVSVHPQLGMVMNARDFLRILNIEYPKDKEECDAWLQSSNVHRTMKLAYSFLPTRKKIKIQAFLAKWSIDQYNLN